jgi:hypothetical protein
VSGSQLLLLGGTPQVVSDPNFEYTTLLLPGNGTNGAQNNTFLDSSTNNFTITRNGNTTQGTFSPFSQTGWGNYFDGTGDYLSAASNAAFGMGSGDYTIECWLYLTGTPTYHGIYSTTGTTSSDIQIQLQNRLLRLSSYTAQVVVANAGTEVPLNEWTHVAFCRSGTTVKLFRNGTEVGSGTDSTTWSTGAIQIGQVFGSSLLNGYMSNLRVVKGTAVYTSNFTPPTAPLTAITNTSLLTCQSNRFIDNSTNAFAITRNGDVSVQAFSPFNPTAAWSASTNGGSGYFDGSGDYLTVADNAALQMGSGDFTIEYWWYPNNITGYQNPIDKGYSGAGAFLLQTGNGDGRILVIASGSIVITSSTAVTVNAWNHMAVVRSGTTLTLYQNGVSVGSATNSTNFNNTTQLGIGATGAPVIGSFPVVGFLSGVRFVKGTAVYSGSTYTVPTAPPTAITNTSLLLNYTNAGIYDATSKNDLETVGNAQISTTQSKFGGSSMLFDGTGDYLRAPFSAINRINTSGNFTIEFWAYFNSVAADQRLIAWDDNSTNFVIAIYTNTSGNLAYYLSSSGTTWNIAAATSMGSIAINTWYHVALVRNGSVFTPYINGVAGTTTTSSATLFASTLPLVIGATGNAASFFNGYIDDFRITNGIARYTAAFTPPTAAFPLL